MSWLQRWLSTSPALMVNGVRKFTIVLLTGQQASIVFDVAVDMVEQCPALKKRIRSVLFQKRLVYTPLNSFYQVLSAEAYTKHGLNVHGVVFDELHAQPTRELYDVMTKVPVMTGCSHCFSS
nr:hypothetical protein [Thermoanaerobacterium sp. RBIITD]